MGIMLKGVSVIGSGEGGDRRAGNHGTLANSSSHAESSWRLKKFTKGRLHRKGSVFQYFTTRVEKGDFRQMRRLGPCRTFKE